MTDDSLSKEQDVERREKELEEKSKNLSQTMKEFDSLVATIQKEKAEIEADKQKFNQVRQELLNMSKSIEEEKKRINEEVDKRVRETLSKLEQEGRISEEIKKVVEEKEQKIVKAENDILVREKEMTSKERTIALEIDRLEVERAEIGELWERLDAAKQSLAPSMDPELVEKQRKEFEEKIIELSRREDAVRTDEQRLKIEWTRLRNLEQELMHMASQLMEKNQDQDKKPKKATSGPVGIREV